MARAYDTASGTYTTASSVTVAHTTTSNANRLMLTFIFTNDNDGDSDVVSGVTYAGVSMTRYGTYSTTGNQRMTVYGLIAPATGTNNVVVTYTKSTEAGFCTVTYSDFGQVTQPDSNNTGTSGSPITLSTTVVTANSWLVSMIRFSSSGTGTASTGTTSRSNAGVAFSVGDSNADKASGSQSMTWTGAGTGYGLIISIKPVEDAVTFIPRIMSS